MISTSTTYPQTAGWPWQSTIRFQIAGGDMWRGQIQRDSEL